MLHAADRMLCDEFLRTGGIRQRGLVLGEEMLAHPLDMSNEHAKADAIREFKKAVRKHGATHYIIIGEAWIAPWPESGDQLLAASKSDRRREAVFAYVHGDDQNLVGVRMIETSYLNSPPREILGNLDIHKNLQGFFC